MLLNFCFSKCETYLSSSMQGLTGVFSLKSQIRAQERRNEDLAASNTSLRKANVELDAEKKVLSSKLVKLKSKNEEFGRELCQACQGKCKGNW